MSTATAPADTTAAIDPTDYKQVENLAQCMTLHGIKVDAENVPALAEALRHFTLFALPPNPKLDEPTGLGAVAEDPEGVLWVKIPDGFAVDGFTWVCSHSAGHWHHVEAASILSQGVTL